jgi:hypothetical protein
MDFFPIFVTNSTQLNGMRRCIFESMLLLLLACPVFSTKVIFDIIKGNGTNCFEHISVLLIPDCLTCEIVASVHIVSNFQACENISLDICQINP